MDYRHPSGTLETSGADTASSPTASASDESGVFGFEFVHTLLQFVERTADLFDLDPRSDVLRAVPRRSDNVHGDRPVNSVTVCDELFANSSDLGGLFLGAKAVIFDSKKPSRVTFLGDVASEQSASDRVDRLVVEHAVENVDLG